MVEENWDLTEVVTVKLFQGVEGIYYKPLANFRLQYLRGKAVTSWGSLLKSFKTWRGSLEYYE